MSAAETENLDQYQQAYTEKFAYSLDNDLILNWYPLRIIEKVSGGDLLELGVGHGFSARVFNEHFDRHVIIDAAPAIIQQFRRNFPDLQVEIVEAYFEQYESADRFDVISMGFVLEHVDDPALVLRRFRDRLRPGGSLFITVPNAESLHRRFGQAAGLLDDLFTLGDGDRQLGHKQLFSVGTLTAAIEESGYESVSMEGLFLKPLTTSQIQSLNLPPETLQAMMKVGVDYPELCCALMAHARAPN